jgi:hypothetical protein
LDRFLAWADGGYELSQALKALREQVDPFELAGSIKQQVGGIWAVTNRPLSP